MLILLGGLLARPFSARKELLKVSKIGPKAYQQCAGFLRLMDGKNVFDRTGVHPESYPAAEKLLGLCGHTTEDVVQGKVTDLKAKTKLLGEEKLASACEIGVPTLHDIIDDLMKPGRDPREELPPTMLRTDVMDMNDLKPGMLMRGTVRNVVDFGVFVDIAVHQDGLVHISEVAKHRIRHPSDVVKVGDVVKVVVLSVDEKRHRISLSMKQAKI